MENDLPEVDTLPAHRPVNARAWVGILALTLLVVWGVYTLASSGVLADIRARLSNSERAPQLLLLNYIKACQAKDQNAAEAISVADVTPAVFKSASDSIAGWGDFKAATFETMHYYEQPDRALWYMDGRIVFGKGAPRYVARIYKVGDKFKLHDFSVQQYEAPESQPAIDPEDIAQPLPIDPKHHFATLPAMQIDPGKQYTATIDTSRGQIVLDLFAKEAPKTVNNFVFLARHNFYDGLRFHRVVPNFVIQGGDPLGNGTGDPGYTIDDEVDPATNHEQFTTGTLAMANSGPESGGCQFFITLRATPNLQGKHTIFGRVHDAASQAVVDVVAKGDVMKSVRIEEK